MTARMKRSRTTSRVSPTRVSAVRTHTRSGTTRTASGNRRPRRGRLIALALVIGGLAFAAGWNPPSDTGVHKFTEASDYSAKRETGCTNSGDGCHGSDDRRVDFNAYHPEVECKTCHEYTGVGCIPCHGPQQHECTGCHDGSMEGAANTARLTKNYPKGHYRPSAHEALGTEFGQVLRGAADGAAHAACSDCHSADLKTAHTGLTVREDSRYGEDVGCAECHNDKKSGALTEVKRKWKKHRCEDCHGESSPAPMHATDIASKIEADDPAGCGSTGAGCHQGTDLHAMHADEPVTCSGSAAAGEPGCHGLGAESSVPTATACGAGEGSCHARHRTDTYSHKNDASAHVPGTNAQRNAVWTDALTGVGTPCGSCHATDLGVEHGRAHSPIAGNTCLGCHNANAATVRAVRDSWPARDSAKACAACHGTDRHGDVGTVHRGAQYKDDGTPAADACVASGCHASPDLRMLHARVGCTIAGCHSSKGAINGSNTTSCGGTDAMSGTSCHTGGVHRDIAANHEATQLDARGTVSNTACVRSGCHGTADVRTLHAKGEGCATAGCHSGSGPTVMTCGGPAGSAGACHTGLGTAHESSAALHTGVEIGPDGTPRPGACTGAGCHPSTSLFRVHERIGCGISGCHGAQGPSGATGCGGPNGTAGSCHTGGESWHFAFADTHIGIELGADGQPQPGACTPAGCHATVSLYTLHRATGCATTGCHGAASTSSCGGPAGTPNACHTGDSFTEEWHAEYQTRHTGVELGSAGTPQPGACTAAGCHATVSLYTLHQQVGCNIPGCHRATPVTSCGGPAGTAASCHTPPPTATCIIPQPPAPAVVQWRAAHTDGTPLPQRIGSDESTPSALPDGPAGHDRVRTPERGDETTSPAPVEPGTKPRRGPARDAGQAPARGPECTDESTVTIETEPVCLQCHALLDTH